MLKNKKEIIYKKFNFKLSSIALTKQQRIIENLLTQFVRAKYNRDFRKRVSIGKEKLIKDIMRSMLITTSYTHKSKRFKLSYNLLDVK